VFDLAAACDIDQRQVPVPRHELVPGLHRFHPAVELVRHRLDVGRQFLIGIGGSHHQRQLDFEHSVGHHRNHCGVRVVEVNDIPAHSVCHTGVHVDEHVHPAVALVSADASERHGSHDESGRGGRVQHRLEPVYFESLQGRTAGANRPEADRSQCSQDVQAHCAGQRGNHLPLFPVQHLVPQ